MSQYTITITKNGPYVVSGGAPLARQHIVPNRAGESVGWREGESFPVGQVYSLCRCGKSANKPFCDGSHARTGFDGTETASRAPFDQQATEHPGPTMDLKDAVKLCALARFCHPHGTVWSLIKRTDQPGVRSLVEHEAGHCPSGRLVAVDGPTNAPFEPRYEPSIGLVDDPAEGVSGPIWVRGGIPVVSADGTTYQVRNRVTLCRCGASRNKPFCDGTHIAIGFTDEV